VTILMATRNRGKAAEVTNLLGRAGWDVKTLDDVDGAPTVEEDGATFVENARKKARSAAAFSRTWVLAEDAGLEVDVLNGEPGVLSARYCGPGASDADRIRKVLERIVAVPDERRTARFRCVMCVVDPAGIEAVFEGACSGRISHHPRGSAGFGYDPIFIPDGYSRTFGELGLRVKAKISHRAMALRQVVGYLRERVPGPLFELPVAHD
jgi:XTP/dITP diphosphohydrolase